ncbi:methylglyoxal reductase (NADPH-dependent) gre2 [Tulasnella sp. 403]|nr:methylglyoxal reductase (NADPH-dependent) gre2 [Tulasnella sp. 403]
MDLPLSRQNYIAQNLLEPVIKGTTEILKSLKSYGPTVERFVITSNFVAMVDQKQHPRPGYVYTEADWDLRCMKVLNTLRYARLSHVFGPPDQEASSISQLNTSAAVMYRLYYNGIIKSHGEMWIWVDVHDLAHCHRALSASGSVTNVHARRSETFSPSLATLFRIESLIVGTVELGEQDANGDVGTTGASEIMSSERCLKSLVECFDVTPRVGSVM